MAEAVRLADSVRDGVWDLELLNDREASKEGDLEGLAEGVPEAEQLGVPLGLTEAVHESEAGLRL